MTSVLQLPFDDLPLFVSAAGFECANIAGEADIQYDAAGNWKIIGIGLDGYKANQNVDGPASFKRIEPLPFNHSLYAMIEYALEVTKRHWVQDAVVEQIAQDEEDAPFVVADYRNGLRRNDIGRVA